LDLSEDLLVKHNDFLEPVLWREAYLLHLPNSIRAVNRAADLGLYFYYRYGLKTRKQRQQFLRIWEATSPPIQYAFYRYFPTGGFAYFDNIVDGRFLHIVKQWFNPFTQLHTPLTEDAYTANLERWMVNFHRVLKPVELKIVQALYDDPSTSQIELADRLDLKQPTVSRVIKVLAEKHFLRFYLVENFPVIGLQPLAVLFNVSNTHTRNQIKILCNRIRYTLGVHDFQNLMIVYFVIPFRRVERFRQWVKQITASLNLTTSKILQLQERSVSRNYRLYQPTRTGWPVDYNPILGNIKRLLFEDWTEQLPPLRSFEFLANQPIRVIKLKSEDFVYIMRASDAFLVTSRAKFYEAEEARRAGSGDLSYRRRVAYLERNKIMSPPLSVGLLHLGLDAHISVYVKCSINEARKVLRSFQLLPHVSGNILEDGSVAITLLLPNEAAVSVETTLQRILSDYGRDVNTGIKPAWEAYGWMIRPPVISENYDFEKGAWIWVKDTLPPFTQSN
ncbi:MAG: winged helix-turn-helix domain-containing protein, partial [Candidatus Hermodarchaeota archaeon]|nr:winged helix-turn-helix domain-containing protein [Candidatus Hermodarchaeota archaeon]